MWQPTGSRRSSGATAAMVRVGWGIGETMQDCLANKHITVADLQDPTDLRKKLREIQQRKAAEFRYDAEIQCLFPVAIQELDILNDPDVVEQVAQRYEEFAWFVQAVDEEWLAKRLLGDGTILFEGAQGMLLDQDYGWHPYTTWTDITFKNAETLLDGLECSVFRLGITRTHMTRHGAGPLVTEDNLSFPDHNSTNPWQNDFRHGHMDFVALRYSIRMLGPVGDDPTAKGIDGIALTRMDDLPTDKWRVCTKYASNPRPKLYGMDEGFISETLMEVKPPALNNWQECEKITPALMKKKDGVWVVTPIYEELNPKEAIAGVSSSLGVPVVMTSHGPTYLDKTYENFPAR
jgi:adenylosuccinate synthase